jgi:carbon-monoxide dehydrogenase small subunit
VDSNSATAKKSKEENASVAKKIHVHTKINGEPTDFLCQARNSLLEVLRDTLHLTGTKEGCNNGNCGACTVLLNGVPVDSCLVLAAEVDSAEIETIEGMACQTQLHPLQQCFLENAALQCGICTPGFIVAAKALLDKNPCPSERDIRFNLAGNLCRCTGYDKIVRAVQQAAEIQQQGAI